VLAHDFYGVVSHEVDRRIILSDPGIDDYRNELLWSPERPTLLDAEIRLRSGGQVIDEVRSYTALRAVAISRDRFMLNGRPYFLRLVLDQGYWPDTLLAAPSDEALRRDVELAKAMGFNGVRKHQKLEDPRYLYWADKLGLLVWEEMPSAYRFTDVAIRRTFTEWAEAIHRDASHPCIVVWVPYSESWGVPELAPVRQLAPAVESMYHLT
jgi:beta-galactosidase/beta-glucuronidase